MQSPGEGGWGFLQKREVFCKKNPANTELWVIARSQLSWHDGNNYYWYLRCDQETRVHKMGEKNPQNGQCYVQDLTDFKENNKKSQDVCLWGEETAGDVAEDLLMRARPGFMSEMWQKS